MVSASRETEQLRLFDGTEVEVRRVRPSDAPLLRAGFAALSPETRYLRFFAHKRELTTAEAERLSNLDGHDALAIGAIGAHGSAVEGMPMGVARFNRSGATTAEAAVVVVDAFQGRGLGRELMRRLGEAARERGFETLELTALSSNRALVALVQSVFTGAEYGPMEEGTVTLRVRLGPGRTARADAASGDGPRSER